MDRRQFVKSLAAAGVSSLLPAPGRLFANASSPVQMFALHPFVENHPEAVFILRTSVGAKTDDAAKRDAGSRFARQLFSLSDTRGIPLGYKLAIKPNLTCTSGTGGTVDGMGIRTDLPFIEGYISGMTTVGFPADNMYLREGNWQGGGYCPAESAVGSFPEMAQRTGVHLLDFPTGRTLGQLSFDTLVENAEVVWKDVPAGMVFSRVGMLYPFGMNDSWFINIAKFKAHGMGLTLAVKNLQGTSVSPLVRFCEGVDTTKTHPPNVFAHFQPDLETRIDESFQRHLLAGYPRWDRPGRGAGGGYGMETWAQRTCDFHSTLGNGIHIVEGIYGRNGDGFNAGPGPGNTAEDFMTNIVIFGRNAFKVDIIGHWLGGHEPGNFGLFHIAKERGLLDFVDPSTVPVYDWNDGLPTLVPLSSLTRTPLRTPYLRRDYNGQNEEQYHLVNEPYDYTTDAGATDRAKPTTCLLGRNYSNPFHGSTMFEYRIPRDQHVRIDVYDPDGRRVDVLVDSRMQAGTHLAVWNARNNPAGVYCYRMLTEGFSQTWTMILLR